MQIITISVKTEDIKDKIIWFLKHLEQDGVEIVSEEDINDLRLLMETMSDKKAPSQLN